MYITFFAGSPCENTVSFLRNLQTSLPRPAESRKAWALKACFPLSFIGDLVLFELAIACIISPLNTSFSAVRRIETRVTIDSPLTDTVHSGYIVEFPGISGLRVTNVAAGAADASRAMLSTSCRKVALL